jgi:hypothetical protein
MGVWSAIISEGLFGFFLCVGLPAVKNLAGAEGFVMNEEYLQPSGDCGERRRSYRMRSVFDTVFAMIEPFFDSENGWTGPSLEHLTFRLVRENFSELTSEEVHSLVVAAHRAYIDRYPESSDHLPRPGELRQPALRSGE